jgi:hypothetical protein
MVEGSGCTCLLREATETIGIRGKRGRKNLNGDITTQAIVMGSVNLAHATGSDLP